MKSLADIITELENLEKTELDTVIAAVEQTLTDLKALSVAADPVTTVTLTLLSGVTIEFDPKA